MSLSQFLGNIGTVLGGQAGGMVPGMGNDTLDTPFAMSSMEPQQQQKKPGGGLLSFFGRPGTKDAMGQIGDYLLQANDMAPIYGPRKAQRDQQMMGDKLAQYLGAGDPALMDIIRANPDMGMQLLKMKGGGEAFTLGDGQVRYDAQGKVIAGTPTTKRDVVVIDGVAFDKNTGEALFESPYPKVFQGPRGGFSEQPRIGLGRRPGGQPQPPSGEVPRVQSPQEAMSLPPGTQFMMPDGRIGTVPGGASGNAGGGFP